MLTVVMPSFHSSEIIKERIEEIDKKMTFEIDDEIDFKVVVFPAPFPPNRVVIPPFFTLRLTPFKTKIT